MQFDKQLMFSEAQDLSQVAATYTSTNVIDMGAPTTTGGGATLQGNNLGVGKNLFLDLRVVEAFDSAGAATVDIQVIAADNAALSTNPVTLMSTGALAYTVLVANHRPTAVNRALPSTTKRFLGIKYVVAAATTTLGTITAGLVLDRQSGGGTVY